MPSSSSEPALDPSSAPPHFSPLLQDSSETDRRLREAEEKLRNAMAELQRRQRSAARGSSAELCDHSDVSCVANAINNFCRNFILFYGVKQLVSEKDLIVREDACRIGLVFGGFTGSFHALRCCLRKWRKKETPLNS